MAKKQLKKFTYAVGRPWHPKDPDSSIGLYAYGSETFHGTIEDAVGFHEYVEGKRDLDQEDDRGSYKIYKLVEVTADEMIELYKPIKVDEEPKPKPIKNKTNDSNDTTTLSPLAGWPYPTASKI